tara:strand:- start:332 stop:2071 length:1740 start_codon:yes stop_codon:yes gene_type:complete
MILLTGNILDSSFKKAYPSFIILDENTLTYTTVPYCESLNSKLCNASNDETKPQGQKSFRPFGITKQQGRKSFRPFGITNDDNYIYIACNENICSFDINTFEYVKTISTSGRVNTHQLCYNDGYIYRCDTAVNCITKINVTTLEETYIDVVLKKIIPKLPECKYVKDKDIYHINSIYIDDNKLYINAGRSDNILGYNNNKKLYDEILNLSNDNYDNSELMKAIYQQNKGGKGMYHVVCIWGDGMDYNDDIKNNYINYEIKMEKEIDIADIDDFLKKIYENEDNTVDDKFIEKKINYLKKRKVSTQKVKMYLLYDNNPNLELYREKSLTPIGSILSESGAVATSGNNYIANTNMINLKNIIRQQFNQPINQNSTRDHYGLLSHNHVIHITNTDDNVDDLLKIFDVNISKNTFDPTKDHLNCLVYNYLNYIGDREHEKDREHKSNIFIFNIKTNSFDNNNNNNNNKTNNNVLYENSIAKNDIMVVNNKTWSLSTVTGELLKHTENGESVYRLVDPAIHYLRGMVKQNNIFYIFATPNEKSKDKDRKNCIIITFDIAEEDFDIRELDSSFTSIRQAIINTPN